MRLPVLPEGLHRRSLSGVRGRGNGADAILLIVAALEQDELARLHDEARGLDLDCVVEVHSEEELEGALSIDAEVIGVNNRNLDDFSVDVQTTFELITDVPAGKTVVSESGIAERETSRSSSVLGSTRC